MHVMSDNPFLSDFQPRGLRSERIPGELIWRAERDGLTYHAEVQAVAFVGFYATIFRQGELWTSRRFVARAAALAWLSEKESTIRR